MNNGAIINMFNSNSSNVTNIKIQHSQVMTTTANKILKFKPMMKTPIATNDTFFTTITFSRINSIVMQPY